jgi:HSP20 family protein
MHSLLDRIGARPWLEGFGWKPDTDIYRNDGELVVQVELPGLDPDADLDIEVEDNVLQIKGEKTQSTEIEETDCYVTERRFGAFCRSVMLPSGVATEDIVASYDNGVLTVRVPLPEKAVQEQPPAVHIEVAAGV